MNLYYLQWLHILKDILKGLVSQQNLNLLSYFLHRTSILIIIPSVPDRYPIPSLNPICNQSCIIIPGSKACITHFISNISAILFTIVDSAFLILFPYLTCSSTRQTFSYTCSHLSALQNRGLLFSTDFQFIFIFKECTTQFIHCILQCVICFSKYCTVIY